MVGAPVRFTPAPGIAGTVPGLVRRDGPEQEESLSPEEKMTTKQSLHYVSDADGEPVAVIVPIKLWREIESQRETAYLLKSKAMRKRLLDAKARSKGIPLEKVRAHLGV